MMDITQLEILLDYAEISPCDWNSLIVGVPVYCDNCPYDVIDKTTCTHSNRWELEALK